jgi:hypothetical protein
MTTPGVMLLQEEDREDHPDHQQDRQGQHNPAPAHPIVIAAGLRPEQHIQNDLNHLEHP